ncbi:MAG: OmpA family protein [Flavobacterium sp.]
MKATVFLFLLVFAFGFSQEKVEVFFDFNASTLNASATTALQKWIEENQTSVVTKLAGYCDFVDNSAYNKELSSKRINAVLNLLKEHNITISNEVILVPVGKEFKQSKVQAANRKVVVYYEKEKKEDQLANKIKTSKKGDVIKLKNIYFYNNSDKTVPKSEPTLKELLGIMTSNPKLKIEIQGHICCKKKIDPDEISSARAKAIYNYLLQHNIDKKRLTYKGYGVSRPIHPIPEKNKQEEDDNRRVEIMIIDN